MKKETKQPKVTGYDMFTKAVMFMKENNLSPLDLVALGVTAVLSYKMTIEEKYQVLDALASEITKSKEFIAEAEKIAKEKQK